jgi:D-alanyl-D-alanine dipeptidase
MEVRFCKPVAVTQGDWPVKCRTPRRVGRRWSAWLCASLLFTGQTIFAGQRSSEPLVPVKRYAKSVVVELRYASTDNIAGRALYRKNAPCLLRKGIAKRLATAAKEVQKRGYRLKVWDAYRPQAVQQALSRHAPPGDYVASGESQKLHTWGVAVDVTLVDARANPVSMPTDFDVFTRRAQWNFRGHPPVVAANLKLLQAAMGRAGFYAMEHEWWHFVDYSWKQYGPASPREGFAVEGL